MESNLASLVVLVFFACWGCVAFLRAIVKHDKLDKKNYNKPLDIYHAWWYN